MKRFLRKIPIGLLLIIMFSSCSTLSKIFRSSGNYNVSIADGNRKSIVSIGRIANRDARYAPFLIDNFRDMLLLQLIDEGYSIKEVPLGKPLKKLVDGQNKSQDKSPQIATGKSENGENSKDGKEDSANLKDLLPEGLRNSLEKGSVVGFSNSGEERLSEDFLFGDEIKILAEKQGFQYFVQGAVGNNSSGTLLEEDSNSLVILRVYDSKGNLKGGITYTVNGRSLSEANLLKEVCEKISQKISPLINMK